MLRNSLLPSPINPSSPPSPHRRLVQPALADGPTGDQGYSEEPASHGISSNAFSQGYFKRFFVEESELGRGGKGVVLLVKHVLDGVSLGYYACKRVPVGDHHAWLEKVLGEVQLLQHLSHQNLVSYRHVWLENSQITTFGPSVPCAFILQQYCNAGDLHNYVCGSIRSSVSTQQLKDRLRRKSKGEAKLEDDFGGPRKLPLEEIYSFFKDITSGLRYLHVNGYIHRDLKPSNCLLHQTNEGLRVLVSDFGEVQSQDAIRMSTGSTGTVSYCAPEVLQRDYPGGPFGNFTFKSDIFSLGMILYFLCFAGLPYRHANIINEENEDLEQLREEIARWRGLDNTLLMRRDLPERLYSYLQQLLSVDPERRPSAVDVLNGIQAGVNEETFRFKASNSVGSDRNPNTRVPLYDRTERRLSRPSPSKHLQTSPVTSRPVYSSNGFQANQTSPVTARPMYSSNDIQANQVEEPDTDSDHTVSPEQNNMIIRPRFSSAPFSSSHGSGGDPSEGLEPGNANHRQLLPPPSRWTSTTSSINNRISSFWYSSLLFMQLALFSFKVATAFQPCSPLATNPFILYPLLLFAALNLRVRSIKIQFFALALHLLTVGLSIKLDVLCVGITVY